VDLLNSFSAVILSARRVDSKIVCETNYSRFVVEAGDQFLVEAPMNLYKKIGHFNPFHSDFALVAPVEKSKPPRIETITNRLKVYQLILGCIIFLVMAFFQSSQLFLVSFLLAALVVVNKTLTIEEAFAAIYRNPMMRSALAVSIGQSFY